MKRALPVFFLLLSALPVTAFDQDSLLNHKMPLIHNKTLDGKTIDESYYKGHLTLVSFMFIGCLPCMNEIWALNKVKHDYGSNPRFQVLCVARQMREQIIKFNSDNGSVFSLVRKGIGAEPIEYTIQPACDDAKSKMDSVSEHVTLNSECNTTEEIFGVNAFPTIFFVDKDGVIRKVISGGPPEKNDTIFYNDLKKEIDDLLRK